MGHIGNGLSSEIEGPNIHWIGSDNIPLNGFERLVVKLQRHLNYSKATSLYITVPFRNVDDGDLLSLFSQAEPWRF